MKLKPLDLETGAAKFDLTLLGIEAGGKLYLTIQYKTKLFKPGSIRRFSAYLVKIVKGICRGAGIRTADLDILTEKEKRELLVELNNAAVQYPEEKLPVPEEFRFIPFLIYEKGEGGERVYRCTSCGICAKVCPPQCIWIVRSSDPETGKPIPAPTEFFIDIDICMNCGLCAEYCPFDAIKMDHDYELASYNRFESHIYNKERLSKPLSYYESIRPNNYQQEEADRAAKAAAKNK